MKSTGPARPPPEEIPDGWQAGGTGKKRRATSSGASPSHEASFNCWSLRFDFTTRTVLIGYSRAFDDVTMIYRSCHSFGHRTIAAIPPLSPSLSPSFPLSSQERDHQAPPSFKLPPHVLALIHPCLCIPPS